MKDLLISKINKHLIKIRITIKKILINSEIVLIINNNLQIKLKKH